MPSGLLGESSTGSVVDVEAFMDSDITRSVARILSLGCLVSIGTTRDGGAISVTITHEGDWDRDYFRTAADCVEWLERAAAILVERGLVPRGTNGHVDQKPVRRRSRLT